VSRHSSGRGSRSHCLWAERLIAGGSLLAYCGHLIAQGGGERRKDGDIEGVSERFRARSRTRSSRSLKPAQERNHDLDCAESASTRQRQSELR